jgi:hypothetical protein
MTLAQILLRGGTTAEWASSNPVLADREVAIDTDEHRFKIGDGATPWLSLEWASVNAATLAELEALAEAVAGATAPVDAAMTAVQANPGSTFAVAQAEKIGAEIAEQGPGIIAAAPSVTAAAAVAAASAVDAEIAAADLVVSADSRLPQDIGVIPGWQEVVTTLDGWVLSGVQTGGAVYEYVTATSPARAIDPVEIPGWRNLVFDSSGTYVVEGDRSDGTKYFRRLSVDVLEGPRPAPRYVAPGDSLSAGDQGGGFAPVRTLASLRGAEAIIWAVPGEASADIRVRTGVPLLVDVPGGQLPTAGSFTVTAAALNVPDGWRMGSTNPDVGKFTGALEGIPYTLVHDQTSGLFTFNRVTAGQAVRLPGGRASFTSENAKYRDEFHIICTGRNNDLNLAQILRDNDAIIAWLGHDRYRVMAPPNTSAESLGTAGYDTWRATHDGIQQRYGDYFIDHVPWMVDKAPEFLGITLDATNLADRASRVTPRVIRADAVHLTGEGYLAWGHYLHTVLP